MRYSAIFFPFKVAYIDDNEYPVWDYFDYSIDAIFFIDIVINFFSAYYDDENNLVTENNQIMIHYISGWFLIDLVVINFNATVLGHIPYLLISNQFLNEVQRFSSHFKTSKTLSSNEND